MRQIVLDTETTGLEVELGHRIIEIGCIELLNRRPTGRSFHRYLNPERDIEAAALAVHGISREKLEREPRFLDIADELLAFIADEIALMEREAKHSAHYSEVYDANIGISRDFEIEALEWARGQLQ